MSKQANTLADVKINIGIAFDHVLDMNVRSKVGEHSLAYIVLEVSEDTTADQASSLQDGDVSLNIDGKNVFSGICCEASLSTMGKYNTVTVKAVSKTKLMDIDLISREFQDPSYSLKEIVQEALGSYGADLSFGNSVCMNPVVSQVRETDWAFVKRIASSKKIQVLVDSRENTCKLYIGKTGFRTFASEDLGRIVDFNIDLEEMAKRECAGQQAESYTVEVWHSVSDNLVVAAGDKIDSYVIHESELKSIGGQLFNYLTYGYEDSICPNVDDVVLPPYDNSVLTGKVKKVEENRIQVELSNDCGGDKIWITYESLISNRFYTMPDEEDEVYLYYENNGKIVCLGSKHVNPHSDMEKPQEKSLTNKNKMIKYEEKGFRITATRDESDKASSNEITIHMTDEDGIVVKSGKDITIHAKENVTLGANTPKDADMKATMGKTKLQAAATIAEGLYVAGAGVPNIKLSKPWPIDPPSDFGGSGSGGTLKLYGYEEMQLGVGKGKSVKSGILLNENISINTDKFSWLGYEPQTHAPQQANRFSSMLGDVLDGLEMVQDIAGNVAAVAGDLKQLTGDIAGASESVLSSLPGVGDTVGVSTTASDAGYDVSQVINEAQKLDKMSTRTQGAYVMQEKIYGFSNEAESDSDIPKEEVTVEDKDAENTKIALTDSAASGAGDDFSSSASAASGNTSNSSSSSSSSKSGSSGANGSGSNGENENKCGDPIDVVTGSFSLSYTDMVLKGTLGDFAIERKHESVHTNEGMMLGDRWFLNIETRLQIENSKIVLQKTDMSLETFVLSNGNWINEKHGDTYRLVKEKDGFTVYENSTHLTYFYNSQGKIQYTEDRNSNRTVYEYEGGVLRRILLSSNMYYVFTYQNGKLVKINDNIGRVVEYSYEGKLLTGVKLANGGKITYIYDDNHCIHQIIDQNGVNYITNEYDHRRRVVRQNIITGEEYVIFYDDKNKRNTVTNLKNGSKVIHEYGRQMVPIKEIFEDGTYIEKKYDEFENMIYHRDRNGNEAFSTFNAQGQILSITYADGSSKQLNYDAQGNLLSEEYSDGRREEYTYDEKGNLSSQSTRILGEEYATTRYTYDVQGRLSSIVNANGNQTVYGYGEENSTYEWNIEERPEGEIVKRTLDEAGRCIEEKTHYSKLQYGYNQMNRITSVVDGEGNRVEYAYNLIGKVVQFTDANQVRKGGSGIRLTYDGLDHCIREESAMGIQHHYTYGNENNLASVTDSRLISMGNAEGIKFEYDAYDNLIKTTYPDGGIKTVSYDANGNVTKVVAPEGQQNQEGQTYCYDTMNQLVKVVNPDGTDRAELVYDEAGNVVAIQEAGKAAADLFTYNYCGWLISSRKVQDVVDGEVRYQLTEYEYDPMGNRIKVKRFLDYQSKDSSAGKVHTIYYTYNKSNHLLKVTDSTGAEENYGYDEDGRLVQKRTLLSEGTYAETEYVYDAAGRLTDTYVKTENEAKSGKIKGYSHTSYQYDNNDNLVEVHLPEGGLVCYTYDDDNRRVSEIHKDQTGIDCEISYVYDQGNNLVEKRILDKKTGKETKEASTYDCSNREIRFVDAEGGEVTKSYDLNGRLKQVVLPNENARSAKNAALQVKGYTYSYDFEDRVTSLLGPDGVFIERNEYDVFGNRIATVDAEDGRAVFAYDQAGRITKVITPEGSEQSFSYDATGSMNTSVDGNGATTRFVNDAWGRTVRILRADEGEESYTYDFVGNVTSATDAAGNTVFHAYNRRNLLATRTDFFGKKEHFRYDLAGNLMEHQDRNGNMVSFTYNMYSSVLSRKVVQAGGDQNFTDEYRYNGVGQLLSAISGGMHYNYSYDSLGRLIEKESSGRSLVRYAYDANGNCTSLTDVTGKEVRYEYDLMDRLVGVKDASKGYEASYTYTLGGRVSSITTPVLKTSYGYNGDGLLTHMVTQNLLKDTTVADNQYAYDRNGNCIHKKTLAGDVDFCFDALGQLMKEQGYYGVAGYSYDKAGNRTAVHRDNVTEEYLYEKNRLLEHRIKEHDSQKNGTSEQDGGNIQGQINGAKVASFQDFLGRKEEKPGEKFVNHFTSTLKENVYQFTYDPQGNVLSDGKNQYSYDGLNRMTTVQTEAGDIQKNTYDAEDLRCQMEENGALITFIYSGDSVISEEDAKGAVTRYLRGNRLLASDSEAARNYYHYASDEMGSITDIVDEEGNGLNHYAYDAFGNQVERNESVANRFGFTGEILDAVTGQYYLRARFYNPVIARFMSEDTYYGDGLNLYSYCHNNPVSFVDPRGHAAEALESSWCANKFSTIHYLIDGLGMEKDEALKWYYSRRKMQSPSQIEADVASFVHFWYGGEEAYRKLIHETNRGKTPDPFLCNRSKITVSNNNSRSANSVAQEINKENQITVSEGGKNTGIPDWLKERFEAGNRFNKENRPRYPYNEVEVIGKKNYVVDSYIPNKEIISRKYTQLFEVKESTGIGYLNELSTKYPSGAVITDSPFNSKALRGRELNGDLILEVPVQNNPVPQKVIDKANELNITIRDITGKEYN